MARAFAYWCVAVVGAFRADASRIPAFAAFVQNYGRTYNAGSGEFILRQRMYEQRVAEASAQNSNQQRLWTAGVNNFWDWTPSEVAMLTGWHETTRSLLSSGGRRWQSVKKADFLQKANRTLPAAKSWTGLQATQYIHNQGACGSCWAIAAATILGAAAELHGHKRTFSVQELVSCVPNPLECGGQGGCRGATVELAVDWVLKHGAKEEHQVPYQATDTACPAVLATNGINVGTTFGMHGWTTLPTNKYEPLLWAIAQSGPIAVSVGTEGWLPYTTGVFNSCAVDSIINHAVVATGYGQDTTGVKFWHLQNSWGVGWGEQGTMRLLRRDTDESECGVDRKPELGVACKGGPSQVTVCGMCGVLYDSTYPRGAKFVSKAEGGTFDEAALKASKSGIKTARLPSNRGKNKKLGEQLTEPLKPKKLKVRSNQLA